MITTQGSATGKVILLGEHVVVHGAPAIASGIDLGARAEAEALEPGAPSELLLGGVVTIADASSSDPVAAAFARLLAEGTAAPAVRVRAESDVPLGSGLGSSAALGVAIGRAVSALAAEVSGLGSAREGEATARACAWEGVFHGTASGIDTAAAASGCCFRFTRATGVRPILPGRDLVLCVGWSGPRAVPARELIGGVARLKERSPELFRSSLEGITSLVENAKLAIEAGDLTGLGRLMDLNQMLLSGLMLSTESIEAVCSIARENGALGAKLTGAGGGGSVIALVGPSEPDDPDAERAAARVLGAWKEAGFRGFVVRIRRGETRRA